MAENLSLVKDINLQIQDYQQILRRKPQRNPYAHRTHHNHTAGN